MSDHLFRAVDTQKPLTPTDLGLRFISVEILELADSAIVGSETDEIALVCVDRQIEFEYQSQCANAMCMDMLYIPRGKSVTVKTEKLVRLAKFGAPAHIDTKFAHLRFSEIDANPTKHKVYGDPNTGSRRDVWHYIDDDFTASRLMVGICKGTAGGWTAWPPHQHGEKREEVYVYFGMGNAFGVQVLYGDLFDSPKLYLVRDWDLVAIPKGYHPNVGSPAGGIQYIYCMAAILPGDRNFMHLTIQDGFGSNLE